MRRFPSIYRFEIVGDVLYFHAELARFNIKDNDGDIFQTGCFDRWLEENKGKAIPITTYDDREWSIGSVVSFWQDKNYFCCRGKITNPEWVKYFSDNWHIQPSLGYGFKHHTNGWKRIGTHLDNHKLSHESCIISDFWLEIMEK